MHDPYGILFEKHVQARFPTLKYIGDGYGKPDFDAGEFLLEVKCGNPSTGVHIPYSQFRKKRSDNLLYLVGFHNQFAASSQNQFGTLQVSGVQMQPNFAVSDGNLVSDAKVQFSPWFVLSNHLLLQLFSQTRYLRMIPQALDRIASTPNFEYELRASTLQTPGFILHKEHDAAAINYFM